MPKAVLNTVLVQVWVSPETNRKLLDMAKSKGQSRSEYIRAALRVAVAKDEREGKESE